MKRISEGSRLLSDKQLRKLAHEYFKVGTNKNSLQAGHWMGFAKYLLKEQRDMTASIVRDEWRTKCEDLVAARHEITSKEKDAECQKECESIVEEIFRRIESSSVLSASIRDDVLEHRHKEWQALKQDIRKKVRGKK